MSQPYTLNAGQYVRMRDGRPASKPMDTVALVLDRDEGTLHKHGAPEDVRAWLQETQARMRSAGMGAWAETLVFMEGRFTLDDLQACVGTIDYAGRLYRQLQAGTLRQLDFEGKEVVVQMPQQPQEDAPQIDRNRG